MKGINNITNQYFLSYSGVPKECWARIIITLIADIGAGVCFFLTLYFVHTLKLNIAIASSIVAFYGLGRALGGVFGGYLSDKFNTNTIAISSLMIMGIGFATISILQSPIILAINTTVLGISLYSFITSNNKWILTHPKMPENARLKTLSILSSAANLGIGLSALIVSVFSSHGFFTIFNVSAVILISCSLLLTRISKHKSINTTPPTKNSNKQTGQVDNLTFATILVSLFFIGMIVVQRCTTYPIYLHHSMPHIGISGVALIFAINPFMIICLQTPVVNFFGQYNQVRIAGVGAFLMGSGMLILAMPLSIPLAILSSVIYTFGEMLFMTIAQFICYQKGSAKHKGLSLGSFKSVYALSVIAGPIIGGTTYHLVGPDMIWYFSGVIGIVILLTCIIINLRQPSQTS